MTQDVTYVPDVSVPLATIVVICCDEKGHIHIRFFNPEGLRAAIEYMQKFQDEKANWGKCYERRHDDRYLFHMEFQQRYNLQ